MAAAEPPIHASIFCSCCSYCPAHRSLCSISSTTLAGYTRLGLGQCRAGAYSSCFAHSPQSRLGSGASNHISSSVNTTARLVRGAASDCCFFSTQVDHQPRKEEEAETTQKRPFQ